MSSTLSRAAVASLSLCGLLICPSALADSRLTALEREWLAASGPALSHALSLGLPIRISVQPTSGAGFSPLSMGFADGVCRFVVSLRENPAAEASLLGAPPESRALLIGAMAFHEIAHCWRDVKGLWGSSPSGPLLGDQAQLSEEAFADLAALAWVWTERPAHAPQVQAWIEAVRSEGSLSMERHRTLPWVVLARSNFAGFSGASPMELAGAAWSSRRVALK